MDVCPPEDTDITWLLQQIGEGGRPAFAIDRSLPDCRTPRRNADVDKAFSAFAQIKSFTAKAPAARLRPLSSSRAPAPDSSQFLKDLLETCLACLQQAAAGHTKLRVCVCVV